MGLLNLLKTKKTVLVIDGASLNEAMGMKGKTSPRNQLQILRNLARFSDREKTSVVIVLAGEPLHKAPAGKKFEGITVIYTEMSNTFANKVVRTASTKGGGVILVSSNSDVEKLALNKGLSTMRVSTFQKVFDMKGSDFNSSKKRQEQNNKNGARNRSPQRRKGSSENNNNNKRPARTPRPPKEKSASEADAINELIDLID